MEDVKWKFWTTDPVFVMAEDPQQLSSVLLIIIFLRGDNGLQAWSPAWIMQRQFQLLDKQSTDKIKHDMIKKDKKRKQRCCLTSCLYNLYS